MSEAEVKREIIRNLNQQYGDSILNLKESIQIKEKFEDEIERIKAQLDLRNQESSIAKTVVGTHTVIEEINNINDQAVDIKYNVNRHLEETAQAKLTFENYLLQLNMLECTAQYMKIIERMKMLSDALEKELNNNDFERCTTIFANMSEISRTIITTSILHLGQYLKEIVLYWHNVLKEKFAKDFGVLLDAIKWPFVNVNFNLEVPLEANSEKLQVTIDYLLQIDLPEELITPQLHGYLADFPRLCLPMQLLLEPLRKRFVYHFYGTRKTNRPDKPEWYFTKILSWIRDHIEFVEKWVQPVVDKMGFYYIDAKVELMTGLVQLAVEKLYADLPNLQYDDFSFSHCIDEALGFDKELKETYKYPPEHPGVLIVLTQAQVFIKWILMEKKYALEKMDEMLSESFTDLFYPVDSDAEDLKIAPCADTFITLLQTITDRYEVLPQPGHRLQFLELQLELLDDFRVRLLQLIHTEGGKAVDSRIPVIANTIFYIENVLIDWGAMLHFLTLYYYKNQLESSKSGNASPDDYLQNSVLDIDEFSVFSEVLSLYTHMRKDLMFTLAESVVEKAIACSKNYRYESWSQVNVSKDTRSLSLTPSACPIFEVLATNLYLLQKYLTAKLFRITWRSIAQQLDTFLFNNIVLENRFSEGGAMQFKFDISRNLFPLFSEFTDKPYNYFQQLSEACALLTVSKGSAILLRETLIVLEGATGVEDRRAQALKEVGVNVFSPQMAISILNRRTDVTFNRISID